jgi:hypothetical protein
MNSLSRLAVCAGLLGLFFLTAYAFCPASVRDAGLDLMEWVRGRRDLDSEAERGEELSRKQQFAIERHLAKNRIASDLIGGRVSLAEAVAQFATLPHPPERMRELMRFYHGTPAPDEEILIQHVIDWACLLLDEEPDRAAAVRVRLENERQALRGGTHRRP